MPKMAWISRHLKSACCWSRGADDGDSKTARTWRAGSSSRHEAVGFSASLVWWRPSAASEQTSNLLIRFDPRCDSFNSERRFFCGTLPSVIYFHQHNLINLNPSISLQIASGDWQSSLNGLGLSGESNVLEMSQHRFHCPNNHNKMPLEGVASLHGDETQTDTLVFFMQIVADAVNKILRDSGSRKRLFFVVDRTLRSELILFEKLLTRIESRVQQVLTFKQTRSSCGWISDIDDASGTRNHRFSRSICEWSLFITSLGFIASIEKSLDFMSRRQYKAS